MPLKVMVQTSPKNSQVLAACHVRCIKPHVRAQKFLVNKWIKQFQNKPLTDGSKFYLICTVFLSYFVFLKF